MTSQISSLHPKISRHFNLEELSTLCFTLEIEFEDLAGATKQKQVQSFLEFILRHGDEEALLTQLEQERPKVAWRVGPPDSLANPYKGLNAFTAADAAYFYGRKQVTADLLAMVRQESFVAVLGASGSGKSSLVFAGLAAKVAAKGSWITASCRPGKEPFISMAGTLLQPLEGELSETSRLKELDKLAGYLAEKPENLGRVMARILEKSAKERFLLIIDQFEELYTLTQEAEVRRVLVGSLLAAREVDDIRLVVTMRADFLGQALTYPPLVAALQDHSLMLGPMTAGELKEVIAEPAKKVGIGFEPGLEDRILRGVVDEPGYLPLLQFALTRLWDEQQASRLTHAGYEEIEAVAGALVQYADETWENLDTAEQKTARQVFTRLVRPGLGTEDTRRVATRDQLTEEWELVQWLADKRLVVTGRNDLEEETAEIVHEALIQGWRLGQWLEEDREFLTWRAGLGTAVAQWAKSDKDEGILLRGSLLTTAENWLMEKRDGLSPQEQAFIESSIAHQEAKKAAEKERQERELEQAQQIAKQQKKLAEEQRQRAEEKEKRVALLRRALIGGVILVLFLLTAIVFASVQWNNSQKSLRNANHSSTVAAQEAEAAQNAEATATVARGEAENSLAIALAAGTAEARALITAEADADARATAIAEKDIEATRAAKAQETAIRSSAEVDSLTWADIAISALNVRDMESAIAFAIQANSIEDPPLESRESLAEVAYTLVDIQHLLKGHTGWVWSVDISPDGRKAVSGSFDNDVRLWDLETGEEIDRLEGHTKAVRAVAFSPDGKSFVSGSDDGSLILWEVETRSVVQRIENAHEDDIFAVTFMSDGRTALSGSADGSLILWDLVEGKELHRFLNKSPYKILSIAISSDGNRAVTGEADGSLRVWDIKNRAEILRWKGHIAEVWSVAFSPNGQQLLSGSADQSMKLWDVNSGKEMFSFDTFPEWVYSVDFSPDGLMALSGLENGDVILWDIETRQKIRSFSWHTNDVYDLSFSPDGFQALSGSGDNTLILWDLRSGERTLYGHTKGVTSVALSDDGQTAISSARDLTLRVWDINKNRVINLLEELTAPILSVSLNSNERIVLTGGSDTVNYDLIMWELDSMESRRLSGHTNIITSVELSSDGNVAVSGSHDGSVILWDIKTGTAIKQFHGHHGGVLSVAFAANDTEEHPQILSGFEDGSLILWDTSNNNIVHHLEGHLGWVLSVAVSPDGKRALSGSTDNRVILWNLETGEEEARLLGHTDWVWSVAFSPDGSLGLSGSKDGQTILWDIELKEKIRRFVPNNEIIAPVRSVAFSGDGRMALTGSEDGLLHTWPIFPPESEKIIGLICAHRRLSASICADSEK